MARSKDELKQYATELAKEKGLSEPQTNIAIAFMTGDTEALKDVPLADLMAAVTPVADLAVGRRADHSRAMGEAQTQHRAAVQVYQQNLKWQKDANAEFEQAKADRAVALGKLAKYEEEFGPLDGTVDVGGGKTVTATGDVVRTADVEKLRATIKAEAKQEMASEVLNYEVERSRIAKEHWTRFKEPLDTEELLNVVGAYAREHQHDQDGPKQISLTQAYQQLNGEKITKMDTDARAAEIKAAEDRGVAKGRTAATAAFGRSGAAISEDSGMVFSRIEQERKAGDKAAPVGQSDDELAAAFAQDLEQFSRQPTEASTQ